jgi:hypothetical protein
MRRSLLALMLLAAPANAWDGFRMFEDTTLGPTSGGGGVWGTGAKRDHAITCSSCHKPRTPSKINGTFSFVPALQANNAYKPGQRYQVTVKLTGEWLGRNFGGCAQYTMSMNAFAATFEGPNGKAVGRLESDSGQDSNACPAAVAGTPAGSTVTYGKCDVVTSTGAEDQTTWTFFWTPPAAGAGAVKLFWGVVDGDCDMKSIGDDVKNGVMALPQGT